MKSPSSKSSTSIEIPIILFEDPAVWERWLEANHVSSTGIWMRLAKKAADIVSVTYAEALEVALCYGWIDGQKKAFDEASWLQKFTPRGRKSIWSQINREKAVQLIEAGRVKPAGLVEIERARADGRWEAAYPSQSASTVPEDLQAALDAHPKARAFFDTLNSANRYAILFRIHNAKKLETRARNIQQFIEMLERGEKLHP